jgi:type VI secretion system protein ImpK
MSNGDPNDPFDGRDKTILRPRPGAGRKPEQPISQTTSTSHQPPAAPGTPRQAKPVSQPPIPPAAGRATAPRPDTRTGAGRREEFLGKGLNPLVDAASPLLVLAGRLRHATASPDIEALRQLASAEVARFDEAARVAGLPQEMTIPARYALCTLVDTAVMATPWGAQSSWAGQPLLMTFHRESWGGDKFFEMLERIRREPGKHIELMELFDICLALGLEGRFGLDANGRARLADLRRELSEQIRQVRGGFEPELSPHWRGVEDKRNRLVRYIPFWVVGALALLLVTAAFTYFHSRLNVLSEPVNATLALVGTERTAAPAVAGPVTGPTLKELLASDEAQGTLTVEESDGQSLVTLTAPDLFASGSAAVNENYAELLSRIAVALNQVPGPVMVVGHTDDQPIRSFRFKDNFDLSRARAVGVAELLKAQLDEPSRLQWSGAGASQPRYTPVATRENRARNRRVEIVHTRGG